MKKPGKRTNSNRASGGLSSVAFATVARELSLQARQMGHDAPSFRSPPRIAGVRRSISRREDGSATVAVATRNRSVVAVIADMIEGVLAATEVPAKEQGAFRDALWCSVDAQVAELLAPTKPPLAQAS